MKFIIRYIEKAYISYINQESIYIEEEIYDKNKTIINDLGKDLLYIRFFDAEFNENQLYSKKSNYSEKIYLNNENNIENIYLIEKYILENGQIEKKIELINLNTFSLENLESKVLSFRLVSNKYLSFQGEKYLLEKKYLTPWIINGLEKSIDEIEVLSKNDNRYLKILNIMKAKSLESIYESNNCIRKVADNTLTVNEYKKKKLVK